MATQPSIDAEDGLITGSRARHLTTVKEVRFGTADDELETLQACGREVGLRHSGPEPEAGIGGRRVRHPPP